MSPATSSHNVDLPEPVAPTTATTSPGSMVSVHPSSTRSSSTYAKTRLSISTPSGPSGRVRGSGTARLLVLGGEHAVDPTEGHRRAWHLLQQEPDDANRERQQREVNITSTSWPAVRPPWTRACRRWPGSRTTARLGSASSPGSTWSATGLPPATCAAAPTRPRSGPPRAPRARASSRVARRRSSRARSSRRRRSPAPAHARPAPPPTREYWFSTASPGNTVKPTTAVRIGSATMSAIT